MRFHHLRLLFWLALFLVLGEVGLEVRASRRGFDTLLFGTPSGAPSESAEIFGPTEEFPFRSPVFSEAEAGLRIWFASSSYAEDLVHRPEVVFPNQTARELATRLNQDVLALNRSRAGYTVETNTDQLANEAGRWEPDLAVLYQLTNDLNGLSSFVPPTGEAAAPPSPSAFDRLSETLGRLYEGTTLFAQLRGNVTPRINRQRLLPGDMPARATEVFRERVERFVDTARELGITPVLVTLATDSDPTGPISAETRSWTLRWAPDISTRGYLDALTEWNATIRAVGEDRGVTVIDLEALLRGRGELFRDLAHFTEEGHGEVARILAQHLAELLQVPQMNFNSIEFLLFLPLVVLGYVLVFGRERSRDVWLLAASYFFYMAWNWHYAGLILFSTMVDYWIGRTLAGTTEERRRKALVTLSITLNLGLLGFFKYNNFFVDSVGGALSVFGIDSLASLRHSFLLPVGISFYTFQSLSYTIDLYRRKISVERSFIKFALFVAFFPQLVAGPIVRAAEFLPQLRGTPDVTSNRVASGLGLVFRGLIKKILIADLLASLGVDSVFADPASHSSLTLLLALYGYSFQIYNDFSGYSDIAIGTARIIGFDLPDNFRRPYIAQNVREFWTRWHISLSTWLRDYLYIPLGGNRASPMRTRVNLLTTMLLGGLWHGAAWNFVLWGGWHGLLLIMARGGSRIPEETGAVVVFLRRLLTFHLIAISWLLFRIGSLADLRAYLEGLASLSGGTPLSSLFIAVLVFAAVVHLLPKSWADQAQTRFHTAPAFVQAGVYAGLLVIFGAASFGAPAFIYFQF